MIPTYDIEGLIASAVVSLFFAALFFGPRRWTDHECDICGRVTRCREWASSKAAAGYVCDECRQLERESEHKWRQ